MSSVVLGVGLRPTLHIDGTVNADENAITLAEEFKMSYSRSILFEAVRRLSSRTLYGYLDGV